MSTSAAKPVTGGAPLDTASFEQLKAGYNFLAISLYARAFTSVLVKEGERRGGQCRVLDIGCGRGVGRNVDFQWEVKKIASDYWGIEPDQSVEITDGLFNNFQYALMETAQLPADSFDIAYSSMVMEHVADPAKFLSALFRTLKPGGSYLFITPNAQSFVPKVTRVLHRLKLDEIALRLLRGKQQVDEYHYPVQFRCNEPKQLDRLAREVGYAPPEYAYVEGPGSLGYLRGPLAPLGHALRWKRKLVRNPARLATLICRMTKPA